MTIEQLRATFSSDQSAIVRTAILEDNVRTDTIMMKILMAHWMLAFTVMGLEHGFYLAGFIGGGVICGLAYLGFYFFKGTVYSRMLMGICLMLFSALYIQQGLGRIEYHFHVFGALAFLIRYKDLRPLAAAVVTIAVHHLIFSYCQQFGVTLFDTPLIVFNYGYGVDIVLLHAAFVIFEAAFLAYIIVQLTSQFVDNTQDASDNLEVLNTLKYVITTKDLSVRLDGDNDQASVVNELLASMNASLVVRRALDKAHTAIVIVGNDNRILDCNETAQKLFKDAADDFGDAGIRIDADDLPGQSVDEILKDIRGEDIGEVEHTIEQECLAGDRTFKLVINPVKNDQGERLGAILELQERTQELKIEREVHEMVACASRGDLSQRISVQGTDGFYELLGSSVNQLVDVAEQAIKDCSDVLGGLSLGDLTETVHREYEGAFGKLTMDVNLTIKHLNEIVYNIKQAADQIDGDASELARGSETLAQRTREQAASLQETAVNMDQMTGTVQKNAEHAVQANQLTADARTRAEHGGDVIGKAVSAMNEISAASSQIMEITGVIDEIAFQTNLLALNASVEAARAGDQGRGFAVVASEVRNLAGRSATAAKEINSLIEDSYRKIQEGAKLVDESGNNLAQIVDSVQKASDIVAEIAQSSQEQSDGIKSVNEAVAKMDEMTNKNASMVEAAAAAGNSMGEQSRSLLELIGFFSMARRSNGDARPSHSHEANPGQTSSG